MFVSNIYGGDARQKKQQHGKIVAGAGMVRWSEPDCYAAQRWA